MVLRVFESISRLVRGGPRLPRWLGAFLSGAATSNLPGPRARFRSATGVAFYYGKFDAGTHTPWDLAARFAQLVIEPEHGVNPRTLAALGTEPIAYLSVGEISANSPMRAQLGDWMVGENKQWGSIVLDVTQRGYQDYLVKRMAALVDQGYSGVFLDTLDSYRLGGTSRSELDQARKSLVAIIRRMARKRPAACIWLNRGFELLSEVSTVVHGIVAESLYDRYVAASAEYERVPADDRIWLLSRLQEAQKAYQLPIVVIDYRPRSEQTEALDTARRIAKHGFMPYVTDGNLLTSGIGPAQLLADADPP